jgi:hypothetical protein
MVFLNDFLTEELAEDILQFIGFEKQRDTFILKTSEDNKTNAMKVAFDTYLMHYYYKSIFSIQFKSELNPIKIIEFLRQHNDVNTIDYKMFMKVFEDRRKKQVVPEVRCNSPAKNNISSVSEFLVRQNSRNPDGNDDSYADKVTKTSRFNSPPSPTVTETPVENSADKQKRNEVKVVNKTVTEKIPIITEPPRKAESSCASKKASVYKQQIECQLKDCRFLNDHDRLICALCMKRIPV